MKYAPWGLSVVLAVLLLFVFISKNGEINTLNQQNAALTEKYNKLVEDANKKQQQLVEDANKKQQQLVEDANKKQQQLIGEATQLITAASLPEATVTIGFRAAMLGSGAVAVISNTSGTNIPVAVEVRRPSAGKSKSYDFVMNAGTKVEIGYREGWAFVHGDVIAVNQPNHKVKITVFQ